MLQMRLTLATCLVLVHLIQLLRNLAGVTAKVRCITWTFQYWLQRCALLEFQHWHDPNTAWRNLLLFAFDPPLTKRAKTDDSSGSAKSRRPQPNRQFAASHHVGERVGQRLAHWLHRCWCQESRYQTGG